MNVHSRRTALLALLCGLSLSNPGTAGPASPIAPCASDQTSSFPAWPDRPGQLQLAFWQPGDLPASWQPPACSDWQPADFSRLMAAAGRMRLPAGSRDILHALAAVSQLSGLRYWSVSRGEWQVLIEDASALAGPDAASRRPDFQAGELQPGRDYFYWQQEPTTSGAAVYRFRLLEQNEGRLVVSVRNEGPARHLGITMLAAGRAESLYIFQQLAGDEWGYYQLSRIGHGKHDWLPVTAASYANWAIAIFRWFASLPEEAVPVWRD